MSEWIPTTTQLFGETVGYRPSDTASNLWFVATLDERDQRHEFIGQVERFDGAYFAYEYPTAEAAAEGAQDVLVGQADNLEEALTCYAVAYA